MRSAIESQTKSIGYWVPAFAGMTIEGFVPSRVSTLSRLTGQQCITCRLLDTLFNKTCLELSFFEIISSFMNKRRLPLANDWSRR